MELFELQDGEFITFQKIIFQEAGIDLSDKKRLLVKSRLLKRLLHYNFSTFTEYLRLVQINKIERTEMINLLTTNETYFFREMEHFDFLEKKIIPHFQYSGKFRAWSAAASVGAEAYSMAMVLDSKFSRTNWEVYGTDINSEVIKKARVGLFPESWIDKIPPLLRKQYCLKGKGSNEGKFLIDRGLASNIKFDQANLLNLNYDLGKFNVIFLRNVLIYFDDKTKQIVIDNILKYLHIGGFLIISHTENLNMIKIPSLETVKTSIFRKKV